jgi:anti-anti-sigma regulatory factor
MVGAARLAEGLDALAPGEHVCWLVGSGEDYAAGATTFAAQGRSAGDRVLIVGRSPGGSRSWPDSTAVVIDPVTAGIRLGNGTAPWELWDLVHRRDGPPAPDGDGALRVLAQMEQLVPAGCGFDELVALELGWGQWAAGSGARVVCAYRQDAWEASVLRDVACMHSGQVGSRRLAVSFRMTNVEAGCWRVDGAVDFVAAPAFGAAARAALELSGRLRLRFDGLEMIDAAGIQELAHAVRAKRGGFVRVEGANPTVRRLWRLSGFDTAETAVEIAL